MDKNRGRKQRRESSTAVAPVATRSHPLCIMDAKQHGGVSRGVCVGFNARSLLHGNVLLNVLMPDAKQQQPRPAPPPTPAAHSEIPGSHARSQVTR